MMKKKINYIDRQQIEEFTHIDQWKEEPQDIIFRHSKDEFAAPISRYLGVPENLELDCFSLKLKKAYKNPETREHICHYLNYFEKFYDKDHELVAIYTKIKCMIDGNKGVYSADLLKQDLQTYILSDSMMWKWHKLIEDNYIPLIKNHEYKKKPGLEYTNEHCKLMFETSMLQIMIIPILTHYAAVNIILNINDFLMYMYDIILYRKGSDINLYNKFYETVESTTMHNTKINPIWGQQDIRAINVTTFAIDSTQNIIINIMPKYRFDGGIVAMNLRSVKTNIKYQVVENEYEFEYAKYDNTKKDEDSNSEFDKFESYTVKQDESLYVQLNHIAHRTMDMIESMFTSKYGPYDPKEIQYYKDNLFENSNDPINNFQKNLVFSYFFKYFGDTESPKAINKDDYIKLVIFLKNELSNYKMSIMPYVISSKITKSISRKTINKKEEAKIENSEIFDVIMKKYSNNDKIKQYILSIIATIFSSKFRVIDYNNPEIDGKELPLMMEFIQEEVCRFVTYI